ncbi:hypothetical protein RJ640_020054, partial [Escallonia rubra]
VGPPLSLTPPPPPSPVVNGNAETLTVPYPFGIGIGSGCSLDPWFDITCNHTFNPPKPFITSTPDFP